MYTYTFHDFPHLVSFLRSQSRRNSDCGLEAAGLARKKKRKRWGKSGTPLVPLKTSL